MRVDVTQDRVVSERVTTCLQVLPDSRADGVVEGARITEEWLVAMPDVRGKKSETVNVGGRNLPPVADRGHSRRGFRVR